MILDLGGLHKNKDEWQRPSEFLPERFDEEHELSKTSSGGQRHKMSFAPFSHGKRNCLGQYFAYHSIKVMIIHMIAHFDLEFVNEKFRGDAQGCPQAQLFRVNPYDIELKLI
jgi:cytochrome P450